MLEIRVIDEGKYRTNCDLLHELRAIIEPSYVDPTALLNREIAHCDSIYLLYDCGYLVSFFMVHWHEIMVGADRTTCAYLGLSAVRADLKNHGLVRQLYSRFGEDAAHLEANQNTRTVLWYTTASPSACLAAYTVFLEGEPRADGSYSPEGARMAQAIKAQFFPMAMKTDHPFVLKNVAENTRYSAEERLRISEVCTHHNFSLLSDLGIDESAGDRLLYVCRCRTASIAGSL